MKKPIAVVNVKSRATGVTSQRICEMGNHRCFCVRTTGGAYRYWPVEQCRKLPNLPLYSALKTMVPYPVYHERLCQIGMAYEESGARLYVVYRYPVGEKFSGSWVKSACRRITLREYRAGRLLDDVPQEGTEEDAGDRF